MWIVGEILWRPFRRFFFVGALPIVETHTYRAVKIERTHPFYLCNPVLNSYRFGTFLVLVFLFLGSVMRRRAATLLDTPRWHVVLGLILLASLEPGTSLVGWMGAMNEGQADKKIWLFMCIIRTSTLSPPPHFFCQHRHVFFLPSSKNSACLGSSGLHRHAQGDAGAPPLLLDRGGGRIGGGFGRDCGGRAPVPQEEPDRRLAGARETGKTALLLRLVGAVACHVENGSVTTAVGRCDVM